MKPMQRFVTVFAAIAAAFPAYAQQAEGRSPPRKPGIVPVTAAPASPRDAAPRSFDPGPLERPPADARDRAAPSSLDRELGTASDGGYDYYQQGQR